MNLCQVQMSEFELLPCSQNMQISFHGIYYKTIYSIAHTYLIVDIQLKETNKPHKQRILSVHSVLLLRAMLNVIFQSHLELSMFSVVRRWGALLWCSHLLWFLRNGDTIFILKLKPTGCSIQCNSTTGYLPHHNHIITAVLCDHCY